MQIQNCLHQGSEGATIGKPYLHMFIEISGNMTQVSDVAPGSLVSVFIRRIAHLVVSYDTHGYVEDLFLFGSSQGSSMKTYSYLIAHTSTLKLTLRVCLAFLQTISRQSLETRSSNKPLEFLWALIVLLYWQIYSDIHIRQNFYPSTIIIFTINPDELEIKDITESDRSASHLDILLNIDFNGGLRTSL